MRIPKSPNLFLRDGATQGEEPMFVYEDWEDQGEVEGVAGAGVEVFVWMNMNGHGHCRGVV